MTHFQSGKTPTTRVLLSNTNDRAVMIGYHLPQSHPLYMRRGQETRRLQAQITNFRPASFPGLMALMEVTEHVCRFGSKLLSGHDVTFDRASRTTGMRLALAIMTAHIPCP